MSKEYNQIYEKLVTAENDFVGMIAYAIYKREKRNATRKQLNIDEFLRIKSQPNEIKKYKREAEELVNMLLQAATDEELSRVRTALAKKITAMAIEDLPDEPLHSSLLRWHNAGAAGIIGNFWTGAIVAVFVWFLSDHQAWQQAKESAYKAAAAVILASPSSPQTTN